MKNKNIFTVFLLLILFTSCDDVWDPAIENIRDEESIYQEPAIAAGLLTQGYLKLPNSGDWSFVFSDVATDDGVTNDFNNQYYQMTRGTWSKIFNPFDVWNPSYNAILYLNKIISSAEYVPWTSEVQASKLFNMRIKGEAYALRAYFMYYLLQAHAGVSNGQLLGVPIITQTADEMTDFNTPRATYQACIDFINSDLDKAEQLLPFDYGDLDVNSGIIPSKYAAEGVTAIGSYNRVMGKRFRGRVSGRIAQFIRGEVAVMAASPAFLNGSNQSWEKAAIASATLLNANNGLAGLAANGWTWYKNLSDITAITDGSNPSEIVWRYRALTHSGVNSNVEYQLFPPTLFGLGRINPSQNIVDAFPMQNGYPITDATNSGYNSSNPYSGRDPRLNEYILYNGGVQGASDEVISMLPSGNPNAVNKNAVDETTSSTRTGYYLRKFTRKQTNLNPNSPSSQIMYKARMRYTEMYLIYAEAANEAYGPTGMAPGASYSAYDVIKAIRKRAGVGGANDPYLQSIMGDKSAMRELIRNERRLELCFENFRFWDLRRWKVSLSKLNEPIRGIKGTDSSDNPIFNLTGPYELATEQREFDDYMYYGPIPYGETLKWSNLAQNDGWN